jgi:putative polyketide hydroxylase
MKWSTHVTGSLNVPVLVVGAGPAGLAAAIGVARQGIECLVVERRAEPSAHPRATVVSTRSMELLRAMGLEDRMVAGGVEVEWLMWVCETLSRVGDGRGVEVGLPTRAQAALISPTEPLCAPQPHLEGVLREHLRSFPSARIETAAAVIGLDDGPKGVRVRIRDATARERVVSAGYVVGADGAKSTVRALTGISTRGSGDVLSGFTTLVRAPLWAVLREHRYGLYATNHGGEESLFLPAGRDDCWIFSYQLEQSAGAPGAPTPGDLVGRIRRAAGIADLPVRIERSGLFSSSAQIADRFRTARTFLVGDAAHRVTPRGGTGMNAAFQGGHDLGWRLAWVLRGWADAGLLDGYECERRPLAAHNVARSADPDGTRRPPGEELRVDLAGRIAHHWVTVAGRRHSTLDMLGDGLTLLTGPTTGGWQAAVTALDGARPLALRSVDEITARALGIRCAGALLVRPDGFPVGSWSGDAGAGRALEQAIAELTCRASDRRRDADAA